MPKTTIWFHGDFKHQFNVKTLAVGKGETGNFVLLMPIMTSRYNIIVRGIPMKAWRRRPWKTLRSDTLFSVQLVTSLQDCNSVWIKFDLRHNECVLILFKSVWNYRSKYRPSWKFVVSTVGTCCQWTLPLIEAF